jgi:hypothetical protein
MFEHLADGGAYASVQVARRATDTYGVLMTAMREHRVSGCRAFELEPQVSHWSPPHDTRWIASTDLAAMALTPTALSDLLGPWFLEGQTDFTPVTRPAWERPGWYADAARWIETECAHLGYVPSGPVEQEKAAWSLSCILKVPTSNGVLYFKVDDAKPPSEPAIIDRLAQRWPSNVPDIIAADHDRRWMLMRDFGKCSLDGQPIGRWNTANHTFATIQVACTEDLAPWLLLGCPDLRIPVLATHMDRLLDDDDALRINAPGGLTMSETTRLRDSLPRLHDLWNDLAAIPIPTSIVQQDFRHGNLVMRGESYVFYDWRDTVISHPFFACCRFLDFLQYRPLPRCGLPVNECAQSITNAYLQPWTHILGLADLKRAFELARRLNPIYLAIRWYLDGPYFESTSSWSHKMQDALASDLRRWLISTDNSAQPASPQTPSTGPSGIDE